MRDKTGSSNQALPVSAAVEDIIVTKYFSAKDGRFLPWRLSIAILNYQPTIDFIQ